MSRPRAGWLPALLALFVSGCGEDGAPAPEATPAQGPFVFVDVALEAGLAFQPTNGTQAKPFITETLGGGVALFDADGDGDLDAYFANGSTHALERGEQAGPRPRDGFFQNDGVGGFEDATTQAGLGDERWTMGVRAADFDGDGWTDLYLSNHGPNVFYRNQGSRAGVHAGFEDDTAHAGLGDPRWSTGACLLDVDRDGDLDLYVVNHIDFDYDDVLARNLRDDFHGLVVMFGPRGLPPAVDRFYRNAGDGTYVDASAEVGIDGVAAYGFQCVAFDYDQDGQVDVYVANDSQANHLWRNVDGRFEERAVRSTVALSKNGLPQAGMGVALGDFDADLLPDLFITNFSDDYFTLYRGEKGGYFRDVSSQARLQMPTHASLGWGCGFADFDHDGDLDLYAVNGHVYPQVDDYPLSSRYRQTNQLFENTGDGRFEDVSEQAGPGFRSAESSRGSAVGDVDNDGDLDILIGNLDVPPTLLRNDSRLAGRSVLLRLEGRGANRAAIGARVEVVVGERVHLRLPGTGVSFLSSDDPRLHFGLGPAERIDAVRITWPDGTKTEHGPFEAADLGPAGATIVLRQD